MTDPLPLARRRILRGRNYFFFLVTFGVLPSLLTDESSAVVKTVMPSEKQTKIQTPKERFLSLKLPLKQPMFHWTFLNEEDLLSGTLILRIARGEESQQIVIFEKGAYSDGWQSMQFEKEGAGEVYFGFQSYRKYPTAPNDRLVLELTLEEDLEGIGAQERGNLPVGFYRSEGTYSGLIDEFDLTELQESLTKSEKPEAEKEQTLANIREMYNHKAFLENWEQEWSLEITGGQGWLPPEAAAPIEKLKAKMEDQRLKEENLDLALESAGFDPTNTTERIAGLKQLLIGEDQDLGNSASTALWKEGEPAIPDLVEVLTDKDLNPEIRLRAVLSLEMMSVNQRANPEAFTQGAVPALLGVIEKGCDEGKARVNLGCLNLRIHSMNALASMGEAGWVAIPVLIELLENQNMGIQAGAAIALGKMGPKAKEAIPRLEELSQNTASENLKEHSKEALKRVRGIPEP